MKYTDGFLIPIPKKNVAAYRRMSQKAGKVWKEYGALEYIECVGDDMNVKMASSFPKTLKTKPDETVIFSWITYKSKAHRNSVNKKIMKDKRIANMMGENCMPFDVKRMLYGGFKIIVNV